jgi:rhodanese-related sulfurtransferase
MKIVIMLLSSLAFVASGCSQSNQDSSQSNTTEVTQVAAGEYQTVSAEEFDEAMASEGYQLVDVRTPGECADGVIEGAQNINIGDSDFEAQLEELDKDKPVLVYCASGIRSLRAMKTMESKGFSKVLNLDGGYKSWEDFQRK